MCKVYHPHQTQDGGQDNYIMYSTYQQTLHCSRTGDVLIYHNTLYQILTACVNVLDGHLHRSTKIFNKVRVVAGFVLKVYVMIVTINIVYVHSC